MEEHLHSSTVTAALWILVVLLSNQSILNRFKEGLCGGGWLDHTDSVLTNKIGTVLGECNEPGDGSLTWLSNKQNLQHSIIFDIPYRKSQDTCSNNVQCIYYML